jgi:hypothetical protein
MRRLPACAPGHLRLFMQLTIQRFIVGAALGALWEVPLSCPGWMNQPAKLLKVLKPASLAMLVIWDGSIFLVCTRWLARAILAIGTCIRGFVLPTPATASTSTTLVIRHTPTALLSLRTCMKPYNVGSGRSQLLRSTALRKVVTCTARMQVGV